MYPGIPHGFQTGNGTCQLPFQAATVTGVFNKLTGTQCAVLIQNFKTDSFIVNEAGGGEFHARFVQISGGYHKHLSDGINLKLNIFTLQNIDDILRVVILHAVNQWLIGWLARPDKYGNGQTNNQSNTGNNQYLAWDRQTIQTGQQWVNSNGTGFFARWLALALRLFSTGVTGTGCGVCWNVFHNSVFAYTGMFMMSL